MTGKASVPSLAEFLDQPRESGPCAYVRTVPAELRAAITEQVQAGNARWARFGRWLKLQGYEVRPHWLDLHYKQGHSDDR